MPLWKHKIQRVNDHKYDNTNLNICVFLHMNLPNNSHKNHQHNPDLQCESNMFGLL